MEPTATDAFAADAVIVGGGIAGLAAAWDLHQRGLRPVVLERQPRAGGVILTEQIDGFTIDAGPDSLLVQKPAALELCRELGLGDRLVSTLPPRTAFILRGGRLHSLPEGSVLGIPTRIGPLAASRLFSWPGKARMGAELLRPNRPAPGDESIGSFIGRHFGREAVDYLAEPLLAGIHAGDVDRLSARALFPRLVESERKYGSLIKAFRHMPRGGSADGAFRSLPGGVGELAGAVTRALPAGTVRCGETVTAIDGAGPFLVRATGGTWRAPQVIVAAPAYVAAALLKPRDAALAALCEGIAYASTATIALGFPRAAVRHPLNGSGFVVPRVEGLHILAATWVSSKWPGRAPDDHVLLRVFVGGARDPQALDADDETLVRRATDDLTRLMTIEGAPILTRLYRWTRANAQYEVGHLDRMAAIDRALAAHRGLHLTGSGFRGVGIPDAIADGRATARAAAQALTAHD
ncbi:MAG: protoporphyrinogen oxidase [Acidobacteriota bacterium]|nr:protoporphyrinogen oxidase [Acidobacteriota bacterium]